MNTIGKKVCQRNDYLYTVSPLYFDLIHCWYPENEPSNELLVKFYPILIYGQFLRDKTDDYTAVVSRPTAVKIWPFLGYKETPGT